MNLKIALKVIIYNTILYQIILDVPSFLELSALTSEKIMPYR